MGNNAVQSIGGNASEELKRLREENERLKAAAARNSRVSMKVSAKGALSVYGMGRFPITLYREQWEKLLAMAEELKAFIKKHESELKLKGE